MISGTYVLTDSIDQAFERIFNDIRAGSNAVITGKSEFDLSDGSGVTEPTFDESLLAEVQALPAVAQAEGAVDSETTQLIGDDGKAVVYGGAPNLGFSIANPDSPFNPLTLVEGSWPGPNQVIVDKETASKEDFEVGELVGVQAEGPVQRLELSGIMQFSSGLTIGGATLAGFDLPTAQRLQRKEGRLDEIAIASAPNTSQRGARAAGHGDPAAEHSGPDGPAGRRRRCRRHERVHHLPADVPARVRRHRALRRLLRHRQLPVDNDRAADSGARDPAHARRLAAAGAQLDRARGARRRCRRVRGRAVPRAAARQGTLPALRRGRVHAAEHRPRLRDAHGDRRAARGDRGDAPGQPAACDPRDTCAPRGCRARGRDASSRPLRTPAGRRRAAHGCCRVRRAGLRPLRRRPRHHGDPDLDGSRHAARLPRSRALLVASRASACPCSRVARHEDGRRGRITGAGQRATKPAADRVDRRGADDRARARDARRDARVRDHRVVQGRGERSLHG